MMRLEGLGKLKITVTSWGLESAAFQLVAWGMCLPHRLSIKSRNWKRTKAQQRAVEP
jgi:hypothetical protein